MTIFLYHGTLKYLKDGIVQENMISIMALICERVQKQS